MKRRVPPPADRPAEPPSSPNAPAEGGGDVVETPKGFEISPPPPPPSPESTSDRPDFQSGNF